jgi:enolase 1/2/3
MMIDATITGVRGRRIWDSRGRPTLEVEVHTAGGATGRAAAPAGASRGTREAVDLRDGGTRFGGMDVQRALANVNGSIARVLAGLDARRQESIDLTLRDADGTPDKSKLGGNAIVATSLACARAAAAVEGLPFWRYLAGEATVRLPLPEIQIFGGGAHAGRRIDIQDLMIMPLAARSFAEALEMTAEVYRAAGELMTESGNLAGVADEGGFWPQFATNEAALETLVRAIERVGYVPGNEVAISLDVAASEFGRSGRYRLALEDRDLDSDGMIELVSTWLERYPIASIEDPLAEDDTAAMARLTRAVGDRVQVIGDDYLVTSAARVEAAQQAGACNAVLIKPNQAGTITEARAALEAGKRAGWGTIVSARSGETEDTSIAHLAVGWNAGQLKVGAFARSERMAKWNEVLRIEEALGDKARFAGREALPQFRSRPGTPP